MGKQIFVNDQDIDTLLAELKLQLKSYRCYGSLDIKKKVLADDRKGELYFTPEAWLKMTALVNEFSTEVQWHGLVRRLTENVFEVYDILVFPHEVTGVTVESDQREYEKWLNALDDDSFNALRFHGHSHVNMSTTPSAVDMEYRRKLVTQLPNPTALNDVFYIFFIINKNHSWTAEIYDFSNNALYSTDSHDIDTYVWLDDKTSITSFVNDAKKMVRTVKTYSSYNSSYSKPAAGVQASATHISTTTTKNDEKKREEEKIDEENKKKDEESASYSYDPTTGVYFCDGIYYCSFCGQEFSTSAEARNCTHDYDDNISDPFYSKDGRWY